MPVTPSHAPIGAIAKDVPNITLHSHVWYLAIEYVAMYISAIGDISNTNMFNWNAENTNSNPHGIMSVHMSLRFKLPVCRWRFFVLGLLLSSSWFAKRLNDIAKVLALNIAKVIQIKSLSNIGEYPL